MELPLSEDEQDWTREQIQYAHALYNRGNRDPEVRIGQRLFDRHYKRARAARKRAQLAAQ